MEDKEIRQELLIDPERYRGVRQYTLDGDTKLYTFKIREQSPNVGPYHNIYIRLRKTMGMFREG